METAEIISLISLCSTVLLALPPFCKMIYDCFRNKVHINIEGCEVLDQQLSSISLHIINMSKTPFSITKITVNGVPTVIKEGHHYRSPLGSFINALDNMLFVIACSETNLESQINILIYTTKRSKPYKKTISSIIELLNEH